MILNPHYIAVIGSRKFNNYTFLEKYLNNYCSTLTMPFIFISGGAKGTDSLVEHYAKTNKHTIEIILPDWKMYQKRAGLVRNVSIVQKADTIIAFWDGYSKGTQHVIKLARTYSKPCIIVNVLLRLQKRHSIIL